MSEQMDQDIRDAQAWYERISADYAQSETVLTDWVPCERKSNRDRFWRRLTVFSALIVCGFGLLLFSMPERNVPVYVASWALMWTGFMGFMWWLVDGGRK